MSHPLVVERTRIYATWWGALMRSDSFVRPTRDCAIAVALFGYFAYGRISLGAAIGFAALGLAYGTFQEYIFHRFFFHKWYKYRGLRSFEHVHMPHHIDLHDGINAGPFSYIPFFAVFYAVFAALLPSVAATNAFFVGFAAWLAWYEIQHDVDHRDPGKLGLFGRVPHLLFMRRHHGYHHLHANVDFGVTTALWDRVCGTHKDSAPAPVPGSSKAK